MMDTQTDILGRIENFVDSVESTAVDLVARLSPWLAPLPTAYLTAKATVAHLAWPGAMGAIAGVVIESLGLASVATALELREYNATRRKSDPGAPFKLAVGLAGVYFSGVTALTVALDTLPSLSTYAPLIFPILSLAGVTTLAIRADHRRRLAAIETVKQERKAARQRGRKATTPQPSGNASKTAVLDNSLDVARQTRKAKRDARLNALVTFYLDNPQAGPTEAGRAVGVSRQTVYGYLSELEQTGRIVKGNGAVKVLEG